MSILILIFITLYIMSIVSGRIGSVFYHVHLDMNRFNTTSFRLGLTNELGFNDKGTVQVITLGLVVFNFVVEYYKLYNSEDADEFIKQIKGEDEVGNNDE